MPIDFLKSEFVVISKKPNATKCSDYTTIGLMSHGIKLLKIILNRLIKTVDREVGELQFGFREKTRTRKNENAKSHLRSQNSNGEKYTS